MYLYFEVRQSSITVETTATVERDVVTVTRLTAESIEG